MTIIPLDNIYTMLEGASVIMLSDGRFMYPDTMGLTENSDNEFMYLSEDETRMVNTMHFMEKDNGEVKVSGSSMYLYDTIGNCIEMQILIQKQLE